MSKNRNKIVIFGKNIYRECILSDFDSNVIKVGTSKGCQIRFNKERFFDEFEFEIIKNNEEWEIVVNNSVYFTIDGVMKLYSKKLELGDEITVKYENYSEDVIKINYFIDFDSIDRKYEREINISNVNSLTIGGNETDNIYINDSLIKQGNVELRKRDNQYYIKDNNTKYGVYINTQKISKETKVNNYDFITIVGYYFYLKDNKLYSEIDKNVKVTGLEFKDKEPINKFIYPKFNRNTRIKHILSEEEIEILPPEKKAKPPKKNLVLTLVPAIATLIITVVLRGIIGGGGSFVLFSAATMTLGIIMSIVTHIVTKREYKKECLIRKEKYLLYIEEKEKYIKESRKKELALLNKKHISLEKNIDNINRFDKELFEKNKKDEDFLDVTLGYGNIKALSKVKTKKQEFKETDDELSDIPEQIIEKYSEIENAPITLKITNASSIGVVGNHYNLCNILKSITIQIVARQFYKDVKLFYVFDEKDKDQFRWIRWTKHAHNEELSIRNLVYDEESKNILLEYLYIELLRREEANKEKDKYPHFIIFLLDNKDINNHPISRFTQLGKELGVTFVFLEEYEELLPMGCDQIIRLKDNINEGQIITCDNGEVISNFRYTPINDVELEDIGLKLAPIYVDEVSLESQLTKNISLFELLNLTSIDDLDIEDRWSKSEIYKSMAAPLGVKTKGKVISLDLNEKNHGPHGLVAGTTGSGKSEILQSYILSMATIFHPYEVGFVIIDFKGGGMVNQFKDLPHLIGAITNIDGREIERSLLSIRAELRKRQEIFAACNVNHIDTYIKKFKCGEVSTPLPHLILIVDEFAELKSDQPEFMKELISAARIGRSLGVHLILATQKPSGVIDDQIWSNSKFKLCLKVQNQSDSNEVLKSPLAAEIKEPGRAYLQVGNNEIFELFQSAYSGASASNDEMSNLKEFEISEINLWGKKKTVFKQEKKKNEDNNQTQLEVIVDYINNYCRVKNIDRLPGICLPPLQDLILINKVDKKEKNYINIEIEIGIYDNPSQQQQAPVKLNLSEGNLFILGSSQYGKTSLLQTIIRSVASMYSPEEANIYLIDFASMILKNFEQLKHVGGVITASDDEKLKTFTKMILKEIEYRKEVLSSLGISSFTAYKEAGYKDMPQIIICLDNMTAFKEMYPERDEELLTICREGIAVGVTVILANSQTNGIGYKYMTNFSNRIALYCNDSSEYSSLFDRCRMRPKMIPGRALISINKEIYEYQNYLAFDGEKEIDRVKDMKMFIEEIAILYPDMKARIIPEIPKIITKEFIKQNYIKDELKAYEIPIGLNYENIELEKIDLSKETTIVIKGKEGKGKSNLISNIMHYIQNNIFVNLTEVYVVDNIDKKLKFMNDYGFVEKYSPLYSDLEIIIEDVYEELERRSEQVNEFGVEILKDKPLLLIINNNRDALKSLAANKVVMEKYKKIINQFKNLKVCFIFNDIENVSVGFNASELLKLLKESKNGFIFDELGENKFFELPINIARNFKKPLALGDTYMLKGSEIKKIRTILSKE